MAGIDEFGICKIGYSSNIPRRVLQLQTSNPFAICLLKQRDGCPTLEGAMHEKLRHLRVRGEWYSLTPETHTVFDETILPSGSYRSVAALDRFLADNQMTNTAFARVIGVDQSTVHRLRKGQIPGKELMAVIFEKTGGAVRADDFFGIDT